MESYIDRYSVIVLTKWFKNAYRDRMIGEVLELASKKCGKKETKLKRNSVEVTKLVKMNKKDKICQE